MSRRIVRAALLLGFLSLAGCAGQPPPDQAGTAELFADGLNDIARLYLDPVPTRRIALAGMARLTRLDGGLAVSDAGGPVVLDYRGYNVARYKMPPDSDTAGWGALIAQVIRSAREMSPRLAETRGELVETAVLRGMTDPLDRFSRYLPPTAARRRELKDSDLTPSVRMILAGDIAVFRITGFSHGTATHVATGLASAERRTGGRLAGVVLDLRGNPGGVLQEGVKLAGLFIASGPIIQVVGRNRASDQSFAASGAAVAQRLPLAVLIDGDSASAAEIAAAALQDRGRGVVIGTSSFGKGTVQTVQHLSNGGELIITWARLVAPSGYLLQRHGVVPTICTDGKAPMTERRRASLDEAGWARLRRSCPPQQEERAAVLAVAEHLVSDPHLYSAALAVLPASTQLAADAAP